MCKRKKNTQTQSILQRKRKNVYPSAFAKVVSYSFLVLTGNSKTQSGSCSTQSNVMEVYTALQHTSLLLYTRCRREAVLLGSYYHHTHIYLAPACTIRRMGCVRHYCADQNSCTVSLSLFLFSPGALAHTLYLVYSFFVRPSRRRQFVKSHLYIRRPHPRVYGPKSCGEERELVGR